MKVKLQEILKRLGKDENDFHEKDWKTSKVQGEGARTNTDKKTNGIEVIEAIVAGRLSDVDDLVKENPDESMFNHAVKLPPEAKVVRSVPQNPTPAEKLLICFAAQSLRATAKTIQRRSYDSESIERGMEEKLFVKFSLPLKRVVNFISSSRYSDNFTLAPFVENMRLAVADCFLQSAASLETALGTSLPLFENFPDSLKAKLNAVDHAIIARLLTRHGYASEHDDNNIGSTTKSYSEAIAPIFSKAIADDRLLATSPLFTNGLVDPDWSDLSSEWRNADLMPTDKLLKFVFGIEEKLLTRFSDVYQLVEAKGSFEELDLNEKHELVALCDLYRSEPASGLKVYMFGKPGTGKTLTANSIASYLGKKILRVSLNKSGDLTAAIVEIFLLRAQSDDVVLHFEECENIVHSNIFTGYSNGRIKVLLEHYKGVIVFTSNYAPPQPFIRRMNFVVHMRNASREALEHVLKRAVEKSQKDNGLVQIPSEAEIAQLAHTPSLTPGLVEPAIHIARANSSPATLDTAKLQSALEYLASFSLDPSQGEKIEARVTLNEVELDREQRDQLHSLITYAKESLAGGPLAPQGTTAVFFGPPGTGKTITAEALAKEIGSKFWRITPSSILSPYVGESEQNIRRIFAEAQRQSYVLFLDEAEGLMTDRRGASQRWEVSIMNELLQQIERFRGVFIAATNLKESLDQALARRFLFHVSFHAPDVETRVRLWKKFLPTSQLSESEYSNLAERVELTGGEIRNVCVRARAQHKTTYSGLLRLAEDELGNRTGQVEKKVGF